MQAANLFETLTRAVEGSPGLALAGSAAWGVASVLLSPCHLVSIPLIVGYIAGTGATTPRRGFATASLFALGVLGSIAAIGAGTAWLGRMAGDVGAWGNYAVGGVFLLMGLVLLDVIPLPIPAAGSVSPRVRALGAVALGLVYGIALGPCTFAYMAPVLAVSFRVGATSPLFATALVGAYGIGHASVIAVAGTFTGLAGRYLSWSGTSSAVVVLKRTCGVMIILGGLYFFWTAR
jgi:cytochrome c-type biogenesis protein